MAIKNWDHFFKPEVRSSGKALADKGKVSIFSPSDTEIVCFVKTSPPVKATLKSNSVESQTVTTQCNCTIGRKGNFCKHIWMTLILTEKKFPDFLESKTDLEKSEGTPQATKNKPPTQAKMMSQAYVERQQALKEKQAAYRKEQYQKQKQRLKDLKAKKTNSPINSKFPAEVESALYFFENSGIELRDSLNKETITAAKKKLARVFHPDVGGSHDEILILNKYSEILWKYISKKS